MTTGSIKFAIALVASTLTVGCATCRHRVADDFRDTVKLNVGVGPGLYAHAKATSFLDAGLGWFGEGYNVGLENRYTEFIHPYIVGCLFPIGTIPGAIPDESPLTALRMASARLTCRSDLDGDYNVAGQLFDAEAICKWDSYGPQKRSPHIVFNNHESSYTEQPLGMGVAVGLLILNLEVGFDPVEFCDLISTMFGLDVLKDN